MTASDAPTFRILYLTVWPQLLTRHCARRRQPLTDCRQLHVLLSASIRHTISSLHSIHCPHQIAPQFSRKQTARFWWYVTIAVTNLAKLAQQICKLRGTNHAMEFKVLSAGPVHTVDWSIQLRFLCRNQHKIGLGHFSDDFPMQPISCLVAEETKPNKQN